MATRSRPEELVDAALEGDLVPLGTFDARDDDNGFILTYPKIAADKNAVDAETEFRQFLDQETGATIAIPIKD